MTSAQHYTAHTVQRPFNCNSTQCLYSSRTKEIPFCSLKPNVEENTSRYKKQKRSRPLSPERSSKKSKLEEKDEWRLMISLYDEEARDNTQFRCFYEDLVIPAVLDESEIICGANDDDCRTQDSEIELCSEYLAFQLMNSILECPCNI